MGMEKEVAKVMINEIMPRLKKAKLDIKDCPVSPQQLAFLLSMKQEGHISHKTLRETLDKLFENR